VAFRLGTIVFRKTACSSLDKRHEVHIVLAPDDEDALASVTVGIRMLQR
jgi:hypothetical protein